MNCDEARRYASGYIDNEWDLNHTLEIEGHLQSCDACRLAYSTLQIPRAETRGGSGSLGISPPILDHW